MHNKIVAVSFSIVAFAISAASQVTGSGTSGTVPVFTGSSTVGNSAITQSGSSVGIGTTSPVGQFSNSSINYGDLGSGQYTGTLNWNNASADGWNSISSTGNYGLVVSTDQTNGVTFQVSSGVYTPSTGQRANHLLSVLGTGNVGIGTTSPNVALDIFGNLHVGGNSSPNTAEEGAYVAWNQLGNGTGETDFINNKGLGFGGFGFFNTSPAVGSPVTPLMFINSSGWVGIGTLLPQYTLDVAGSIRNTLGVIFPDGSKQMTAWTGVLCGGDYAEAVNAAGSKRAYEPGDAKRAS